MTVTFDGMCHTGMVRPNNEDMILVDHDFVRNAECRREVAVRQNTRACAMVADGMGGYEGGEYASELALRLFDEFVRQLPPDMDRQALRVAITEWVIATHVRIDEGDGDVSRAKMGTTLAGCFFYERHMYWVNIGDSRIYILRDGILRQVTTDHTLCNLMHDGHIPSNVIYNCLGGGGEDVFADFDELPYYPGDRLLICSDGLSDVLSEAQIKRLLEEDAPANFFVTQANDLGAPDNVSCILLSVHSSQFTVHSF